MKGLNCGERGGHSGYPLVKKYLFQVHWTHLWGRLSSVTSPDLPPNKVLIEKERRNAVPLLHGFRGRKSPSMLYKDYGLCYKHLDKCVRDVLTIISECMKHKIFIYSIYKYIIQYCLPVMSYIPIWHFTTSIMPTDSYKSESLKQVSKINGSTRFLDKRLCKKKIIIK